MRITTHHRTDTYPSIAGSVEREARVRLQPRAESGLECLGVKSTASLNWLGPNLSFKKAPDSKNSRNTDQVLGNGAVLLTYLALHIFAFARAVVDRPFVLAQRI